MKITILFFGVAQDLAEMRQVSLSLTPGCTVGSLRQELSRLYPGMDESLAYAIAVNEKLSMDERELFEGDIVAVLPPVSGG
jgi:molybdopterin converting factor small subunit